VDFTLSLSAYTCQTGGSILNTRPWHTWQSS